MAGQLDHQGAALIGTYMETRLLRHRRHAMGLVRVAPWARFGRLVAIGLVVGCALAPLAGSALAADDWTTINKDYSSQRYVDLDQITPANVGQLKEICEIGLNEPIVFSSGLLKVDNTLYVNTAHLSVAFDATTCDLRWRDVISPKGPQAGDNNRGSAYLDGRIFRGTTDGRLIALDAKTGRSLWDVQGANPALGELFSAAPIAWQGKVFIGIGVSDFGVAGRLMAFDADTGKELWRFNTTFGARAGGGSWATYSLDPATGEVFGPVGNPFPDWNRNVAAGDRNLTKYTDSVIAVDTETGRLNWSYQVVPQDEHDWDLAAAPTLYRTSSGKDMIALAGKSGRVYGIDRQTRSLVFNTPATTIENDQIPVNEDWMRVCPGVQGGAMFNGAAYDPLIGTLYVGMNDHCAWYISGRQFGDPVFAGIGGTAVKDWPPAAKLEAPRGWITAINGKTGAVLWQYHAEAQVQAGMVPTKSGLLFAGDTHGNLLVFDARNGFLLKKIDAGGALNSGLISYSVGGAQFVAATVGGATENPSTVAGPLRVSIYGLNAGPEPKVITLPRLEPQPSPGQTVNDAVYLDACSQCHGVAGLGSSAPPFTRQSQLADPARLKQFLATVPPPMPRLYPGVLQDKDVEMIAAYLRTAVFKCGPNEIQSCELPAQPKSGGTKEWRAIYSVLTSPRCLNCHPVKSNLPRWPHTSDNSGDVQDYPRQGDDRHPHYFQVLRGDTTAFETAEKTGIVHPGIGTPYERCTFCHGPVNDAKTGIPGTTNPDFNPGEPFWLLAPASMAWESAPGVPMTGAQLCAQLKDRARNGNRSLADIQHHLETEPLVNWAWNPGTRPNGQPRTTPPISHSELLADFQKWIAGGAPCPTD
jgi:alcohol dehydrogenase (cytochrome c)